MDISKEEEDCDNEGEEKEEEENLFENEVIKMISLPCASNYVRRANRIRKKSLDMTLSYFFMIFCYQENRKKKKEKEIERG